MQNRPPIFLESTSYAGLVNAHDGFGGEKEDEDACMRCRFFCSKFIRAGVGRTLQRKINLSRNVLFVFMKNDALGEWLELRFPTTGALSALEGRIFSAFCTCLRFSGVRLVLLFRSPSEEGAVEFLGLKKT